MRSIKRRLFIKSAAMAATLPVLNCGGAEDRHCPSISVIKIIPFESGPGSCTIIVPFMLKRIGTTFDGATRLACMWFDVRRKDIGVSSDGKFTEERLRQFAFGQPIGENQSPDRYTHLPTLTIDRPDGGSVMIHRANIVGLSDLIKFNQLPNGSDGEAWVGRFELPGDWVMETVFADSVGAARRWLNDFCDYIGHDKMLARLGIPANREWNYV